MTRKSSGDIYEDAAAAAKDTLQAGGVVLIVANGVQGSGFVVQMDRDQLRIIPSLLRQMAFQIEHDVLDRVGTETPDKLH